MSATRASSAFPARPKTMPRGRGKPTSAVSASIEPSSSVWTQTHFTLDPKSRGIFIWTDTLTKNLPSMRDTTVGMVNVFLRSTNCALSINENCDPDVRVDLQNALQAIVGDTNDCATDAHRTSAVGVSVDLPIHGGNLALGTWQGLYLLASEPGPVEVVATLCVLDEGNTKNVKLKAPSRGEHGCQDTLSDAMEAINKKRGGKNNNALVNVTAKHTSASLAIMRSIDDNGNTIPLEPFMSRIVPESWNYPNQKVTFSHTDEGDDDMPAHVKSTLLGVSKTIPLDTKTGNLFLDSNQSLFLVEHRDGGGFAGTEGSRDATVTVLDDGTIGQTVIDIPSTSWSGKTSTTDVTSEVQKTLDAFISGDENINTSTGWLHVFAPNPELSVYIGENNVTEGATVGELLVHDEHTENRAQITPELVGVSITIPFADGTLLLGNSQAVILNDCSKSGGSRKLVVTAQGGTR